MSSIGPKTPHSPSADGGRMAETLARLRRKQESKSEGTSNATAPTDAFNAPGLTSADGRAAAQRLGGTSSILPATALSPGATPGSGARGLLDVRLGGLRGAPALAAALSTVGQPGGAGALGPSRLQIIDGPHGKVARGDLVVERSEDLALLRGVVTFSGNLALAESATSPADLEALRQLAVIEGNFAVEGNRALTSLAALGALTEIQGSFYAGFNDGLERLDLPRLREVGGALVVEGHARLESIDLAGLESVGKYVHLHENDKLERALFGALRTIGAEVSILENPRLVTVAMPLLAAGPGDVEIAQNGAQLLGNLGIV